MSTTKNQITQYLTFRLLVLFSVLLSCLLLRINRVFTPQVAYAVLSLTAFSFLMTTIFIVLKRKTERVTYFVSSQVVYDILFTTALTFYTGTTESIYVTYYLINIMFSAVLINGAAAIISASAIGCIYFLLTYFSSDNFTGERSHLLMTTETSFLVVAILTAQLVNEIKRTRAKIGRLEELSDEIIESLDAALVRYNEKGIITRVNKTAKILLGVDDSIVGVTVSDILPLATNVGASVQEIEVAGSKRRFLVSNVIMTENAGMILFRDLTEILHLEEKVKLSQHLASVGALAASLAHEIRNPIASISGAAQMLQQGDSRVADQKKLASLIVRETERVDLLIGQLLKFAKVEPVDFEKHCNADQVVLECVESLKTRNEFKENPVEIIIEPEDLNHKGFEVRTSGESVTEVVSNILLNAHQALKDDRIEKYKKITVKVKRSNTDIEISIIDNGPGIPKEVHPRVFDPFYTTKSYGTGLGLARVYKIIQNYGGQIDLESPIQNNKGTLIKFKLPAAA